MIFQEKCEFCEGTLEQGFFCHYCGGDPERANELLMWEREREWELREEDGS